MRWMRLTVLSCALFTASTLAGCRSAGEDVASPADHWSSKDQSAMARDPMLPRRSLPKPVTRNEAVDLRQAAVDLLLQAADSTNPLLRANAVEALQVDRDHIEAVVRVALGDENRGVRFIAAMTVGQLRLDTIAHLAEPLLMDESDSVRAAAIYALRQCGRRPDRNPLAQMIMSDDPEVKGNAALVLGELGDSSAIPMLREAVRTKMARAPVARVRIVDLQIAEAMVKLGAESELQVIRAALFAPEEQGEIAVLACQLCGRLRDQTYAATLLDMATRTGRSREPAEIRLAAAQALAQMQPSQLPLHVPLAYVDHQSWELRMQAATTLGWLGGPAAMEPLRVLLDDANPLVQVAAAGAVLRAAES